MKPAYDDGFAKMFVGDASEVLAKLSPQSVHACVCSPPYFGLRSYLPQDHPDKAREGGTQEIPEQYVAWLVEVFRGVWRVLRDDGTLWLNLGDSYAGSWGNQGRKEERGTQRPINGPMLQNLKPYPAKESNTGSWVNDHPVYKPKDLLMIPARVALALQADGWVLRQAITWCKTNPMPESVTDRCTQATEMIYMLSKSRWVGAVKPLAISERDAAWLAAIIDGEGTICFQRRENGPKWGATYSVRLSVVNTHVGLLERISEILGVEGGPFAPSPRRRKDGKAGRPVYCWQVVNAKAARVIATILPHLVVKQRQGELALYVHNLNQKHKERGKPTSRTDQQNKERAAAACSELNRGGQPELSWFKPLRPGRWVPMPYMYDAEAVKEKFADDRNGNPGRYEDSYRRELGGDQGRARLFRNLGKGWNEDGSASGRNLRNYWQISTRPFSGSHYAVFPEEIPLRCIKAGTSEHGVCSECGAPWLRVVERPNPEDAPQRGVNKIADESAKGRNGYMDFAGSAWQEWKNENPTRTIGFEPTCSHDAEIQPATILDPFSGSGTTGLVARKLGRRSVLIDIDERNMKLLEERMVQGVLL